MKGTKNYIIALAIVGLILLSINVSAATLIAKFEGLELKAYQDSAGIWTIGYGNTRNPYTGLPIKKGDTITKKRSPGLAAHYCSRSRGRGKALGKGTDQ